MIALDRARRLGLEESHESWEVQRVLVDELAGRWREKDNGIWEVRGPRRHFTHSRVMVWAAFDRAVRAVEDHGLPGDVDRWRELRHRVHEEVLERGFDRRRGTFTQHYDTTEVDASLLLDPHRRLPALRRRARPRHHPGRRGGPPAGRLRPPVPHRDRGGRALRRREPLPRLLVVAGRGVRALSGGSTTRGRSWSACSGSSTTSASSPRSTTRGPGGSLGNFPQAFSHLALVGAAQALMDGGDATGRRE